MKFPKDPPKKPWPAEGAFGPPYCWDSPAGIPGALGLTFVPEIGFVKGLKTLDFCSMKFDGASLWALISQNEILMLLGTS